LANFFGNPTSNLRPPTFDLRSRRFWVGVPTPKGASAEHKPPSPELKGRTTEVGGWGYPPPRVGLWRFKVGCRRFKVRGRRFRV